VNLDDGTELPAILLCMQPLRVDEWLCGRPHRPRRGDKVGKVGASARAPRKTRDRGGQMPQFVEADPAGEYVVPRRQPAPVRHYLLFLALPAQGPMRTPHAGHAAGGTPSELAETSSEHATDLCSLGDRRAACVPHGLNPRRCPIDQIAQYGRQNPPITNTSNAFASVRRHTAEGGSTHYLPAAQASRLGRLVAQDHRLDGDAARSLTRPRARRLPRFTPAHRRRAESTRSAAGRERRYRRWVRRARLA